MHASAHSATASLLPTDTRVVDFSFEKYAKLKPHSVVIQKRWTTQTTRKQDNAKSLLNLDIGASKNGNLHFHVILDRGLPAARIQQEWNRIIERLGYVTRFRNRQNYIFKNGFHVRPDMMRYAIEARRKYCRASSEKFNLRAVRKAETQRQREAYEKGTKSNWSNPPTTKIHAIQNIRKLTAYVAKAAPPAAIHQPNLDFNEMMDKARRLAREELEFETFKKEVLTRLDNLEKKVAEISESVLDLNDDDEENDSGAITKLTNVATQLPTLAKGFEAMRGLFKTA